MNRLRALIREIHRRSLWQVVGIYAAGSWLGYQVILALTHGLGLPDWVPPLAVVLFVIGLPVVVATAFVNEGAPALRRRRVNVALSDLALAPEFRAPDDNAAGRAPGGSRHPLTWPRALLAGVLAFVLLGASAGAYSGLRSAGIGPMGTLLAKGKLAPTDALLLADLGGAPADSLLTAALTEALRIDLGQSRTVLLVSPATVRNALARMQREPDTRLDEALAREVALRENVQAVLAGEAVRVAGSWVLTARLIEAENGAVLAGFRETANDSTALLAALDRLSRKLRTRVGESLREVRASEPLAHVTTSSLEALRLFTQARRLIGAYGDEARALPLLEEAVAIDTAFASAYRGIAITLWNQNLDRARMIEAAARAYRFGDRLTEQERLHNTLFYHHLIGGDIPAAIAAGERLVERYPNDFAALNNVGLLVGERGDYERAIELFRRAVEVDSTREVGQRNLFFALGNAGRFDEVARELAVYRRRFGDSGAPDIYEALLQAARGNYTAAIEQTVRSLPGLNPSARVHGLRGAAGYNLVIGRAHEAARYFSEAQQHYLTLGNVRQYHVKATFLALVELRIRGRDAATALAHVERALRTHPLEPLPPADRPYTPLAAVYAEAGDIAHARALLADYVRLVPPEERTDESEFHHAMARGRIALAERQWADGIHHLRAADERARSGRSQLTALSEAFERAGMPDSAIAYAERYLATHRLAAFWDDQFELVPLLERLGRLYEAKGEREPALRAWARITELWQDADPELQPRVRAARERVRALSPD
jgi:eukaryotic-like serine/threonine-protein kinase